MQICYGFIKHTSNSLGLAALSTSFDKVVTMHDVTTSHLLLDLSTRLDYFDAFPEPSILKVADSIDNGEIGHEVLRILVWEHFKLFRRDYRSMQRICTKLNIKYNVPTFFEMKDKKMH